MLLDSLTWLFDSDMAYLLTTCAIYVYVCTLYIKVTDAQKIYCVFYAKTVCCYTVNSDDKGS